jgi:hypothetical protein
MKKNPLLHAIKMIDEKENNDIIQAAIDFANKTMPNSTGAMKNMIAEIFEKGIQWYKEYLKSKQ